MPRGPQHYQVRWTHPATVADPASYPGGRPSDGKAVDSKSSYASRDTASGTAKNSSRAWEDRGSQGHITLTDKRTGTVLFEWYGADTPQGAAARDADPEYGGTEPDDGSPYTRR